MKFKTLPLVVSRFLMHGTHSLNCHLWGLELKRNERVRELQNTRCFRGITGSGAILSVEESNELDRAFANTCNKTEKLAKVLNIFAAKVEKHNQKMLEEMTQEEAKSVLMNLGKGCLAWFENLPYGISPQIASNKTGISFYLDHGWKGNVRTGEWIAPNKKPKKNRMVAKRI